MTVNVEKDIESAVGVAGFGKFSIKIIAVSNLIYLNTALNISSVGLVLPSAACDFDLTSIDKGRMASAPMLGMAFGSFFWGCLADLSGRKYALLIALIGHGVFEILSSIIASYWGFLILKFFSGFCVIGHPAVVFTYLGEFQTPEVREKVLCWMEMAWSVGMIAMPLLGWAVIPLKISFKTEYFFFHSWNLFVLICGLPSLLIALWLMTCPETPKYLAETKNYVQLAKTMDTMHQSNTGQQFEEFLVNLSKSGCDHLSVILRNPDSVQIYKGRPSIAERVIGSFEKIGRQTITLLKPPFLFKTLLVYIIMFCLGSSYFALMLWFPDLFEKFARFEKAHPDKSANVCTVSGHHSSINATLESEVYECTTDIPTDVYIHTILLGISCLPVSIILPLFVHKLGYKFYLVFSSAVGSAITVGLFFVKSSIENLILSCIYESLTSVSISIILCVVVEIFPTKLRAMASALPIFFSRLGALTGNSMFGHLIDKHCASLIIIMSVQLLVCAVLEVLIPMKEKKLQNEIKIELDQK